MSESNETTADQVESLAKMVRASYKHLENAIDKQTERAEKQADYLRDLGVKVTEQLGDMNSKVGNLSTTIKIGGAIATLLFAGAVAAAWRGVGAIWDSGRQTGELMAKMSAMEERLNEHIKDAVNPVSIKEYTPEDPKTKSKAGRPLSRSEGANLERVPGTMSSTLQSSNGGGMR